MLPVPNSFAPLPIATPPDTPAGFAPITPSAIVFAPIAMVPLSKAVLLLPIAIPSLPSVLAPYAAAKLPVPAACA